MSTSLLALLDDIATILDDVALLKVAAQKTTGVLGDDLALNASRSPVCGLNANCPWCGPWARAPMVNKAILVPAALAIPACGCRGRWRRCSWWGRLPMPGRV